MKNLIGILIAIAVASMIWLFAESTPGRPPESAAVTMRDPVGGPMTIARSQVVLVTPHAPECKDESNTLLWLANGRDICVTTSYGDVIRLLNFGDGK